MYCLCQIMLNRTLSHKFEKWCKFSNHTKAKSCKKKSYTKRPTCNCLDIKKQNHSMADVALPSHTAYRQQTKICAASNKQMKTSPTTCTILVLSVLYSWSIFVCFFFIKKVDTYRKHCTVFTKKKNFQK